jgi:hypothetical protein
MSDYTNRKGRNRIVINAPPGSARRRPAGRQPAPRRGEGLVAISVIAAAALATFIALFLTSRPYDPMNSTVLPQASVPQGPVLLQPSPKPSPSTSPPKTSAAEATPEPETAIPNDAAIQSQIEKTLAAHPVFSSLDVSTLVEGGKVTIVGAVKSPELKQRVEKAIQSVKGVTSVDNQLVVTEATP